MNDVLFIDITTCSKKFGEISFFSYYDDILLDIIDIITDNNYNSIICNIYKKICDIKTNNKNPWEDNGYNFIIGRENSPDILIVLLVLKNDSIYNNDKLSDLIWYMLIDALPILYIADIKFINYNDILTEIIETV